MPFGRYICGAHDTLCRRGSLTPEGRGDLGDYTSNQKKLQLPTYDLPRASPINDFVSYRMTSMIEKIMNCAENNDLFSGVFLDVDE